MKRSYGAAEKLKHAKAVHNIWAVLLGESEPVK